ncbi:DUF411 domain-containing protein [Marinihelvus fidelis]|uniref:DUF411 domain-containing protein n=1 Tax=Marinihelvus fidelis TaxID=2613842 RepID=A0A5N0TFJ9_9GAMM|nr:DUF411 domain-containing protein [Marinihelvus fidelis]KAA9133244.1 DUF411 domain-containing protein [Marinihelvus fidelis]
MNVLKRRLFACSLALVAASVLVASTGLASEASTEAANTMVVYKSPTCGCCVKWVDHVEAAGFTATTEHPADLLALKDDKGIPARSRSCHTGVTPSGYVFEGHVPARFILQFLADPPANAIGLAVPAMPVGSPGMEVGDRFMPYDVQLLMADGTTTVFARVETAADQYPSTAGS